MNDQSSALANQLKLEDRITNGIMWARQPLQVGVTLSDGEYAEATAEGVEDHENLAVMSQCQRGRIDSGLWYLNPLPHSGVKKSLQEKHVPVSKTRSRTKQKPSMSKDAKRKIRRWTFRVDVHHETGMRSFRPPTLSIGDRVRADAAAADLKQEVITLPQFKDSAIVVIAEPQETVSIEILNQISGLDQQGRTLATALRTATALIVGNELSAEEKAALDSDAFSEKVTARMTEFVAAEQKLEQRQQLIAAGIDPDAVVNEAVEQELEAVPAEYALATEPVPQG